jgi:hypothetical protein
VAESGVYEGDGDADALSGAELVAPASDTWGEQGWYGSVADMRMYGGRIRRGYGVRHGE